MKTIPMFAVLTVLSALAVPAAQAEEFIPHKEICFLVEQTTAAYAQAKRKLPAFRKEHQKTCTSFERDPSVRAKYEDILLVEKYGSKAAKDPNKYRRLTDEYEQAALREIVSLGKPLPPYWKAIASENPTQMGKSRQLPQQPTINRGAFAEPAREVFNPNSDEHMYGPDGGKCTDAAIARAMYEQQGLSLPKRFEDAITKCQHYARLEAENRQKNPPKHGPLYRSDD